jgi:hypothetical protein
MPGRSHAGALPPLTEAEAEVERRLQASVSRLAGDIGERNIWRAAGLAAAAAYVQASLRQQGYDVEEHSYDASGLRLSNLAAELPGRTADVVVVGAHYDTVRGSPGANDNATGVAVLLEIARLLRPADPARTLRFVAFPNEEAPFFMTGAMGSARYAQRCRARRENVVAMISLETLGCYRDEPGTQQYPLLLGALYPSRGNFVAFVGNDASSALVAQAIGAFRSTTAFPSEGIAGPEWIPGLSWSDHAAFWREGYPALMVTDTAPYRYPEYHGAADTPDRIDYERLARVCFGLSRVVAALSGSGAEP